MATHGFLSPAKPLLRWAGSKKRQTSHYAAHFPTAFEAYVEPFAGSASFCFALGLERAKLNDINAELISFYENARTHPELLYALFKSMIRTADAYYDARRRYNELAKSFEKAVLFYFLNRNCFNGIYRVNKDGRFNVPFASDRISSYPTRQEFLRSTALISDAKLVSSDFQDFCHREVERGDFVFLDPPYAMGGWTRFHHYNKEVFSENDLGRLSGLLFELDQAGATFMLSFPEHALLARLAHWNKAKIQVRRTIAGRPAFRGMAEETLIFNYDA